MRFPDLRACVYTSDYVLDIMMKILIIDDDEYIRKLIRKWLEREGYEVFEAEDGKQGFALQQKTPVDFLICDLIMPVQEGIETITRFNKEFAEVGIIAISGGGKVGPESYLEVAQHLGAWKVFTKPVDMVTLVEAINQWKSGADKR